MNNWCRKIIPSSTRLQGPVLERQTRVSQALRLVFANPYLVAVALIAFAAGLRVWPLHPLGSSLTWLTFYPAVMVSAIYGGLFAGLLSATLACLTIIFAWPLLVAQPFIQVPADWLGLAVFLMTGTMISAVAEAMRRANVRAKRAQEEAEAANRSKSVFLASMSHELRTPLNAILGFTEIMRRDPRAIAEQRRQLEIIAHSGEHLLALINDVLDMAKIDAGRMKLDPIAFDLDDMLQELLELMGVRAEEKGLQLLLDKSADLPRCIRTDMAKLRQAIINLLGNAIKFTAHGGVTLRLGMQPGDSPDRCWLIIEVEDSGVGIGFDDQQRIFEAFVQVGPQAHHSGSGLGLSITRRLVDLMGGKVSVESVLCKGSNFRIELPVERVDAAAVPRPASRRETVIGLAPGQPAFRILVVDDQIENRLLLQHILEPLGFQLRLATNGEEAIAIFSDWKPQLILMDIRMPVIDGIEATRRVRALPDGQAVRIVAVTASVFQDERARTIAAGMDDLIRKPYHLDEIHSCLTTQLGVRFLREQAPLAVAEEVGAPLSAQALAAVPEAWRAALGDAVDRLDSDAIKAAITPIAQEHPALGKALASHAEQFLYTEILQALNRQPVTSTAEITT